MFGIQSSFRLWNSRCCVRPKPVTFNHSQPIAELYGALKRSKVGKAPGPDSLSMDWIKVSPLQSKHLLLAHNSCLFAADAPDSWKLARVAMIYKGKGKDPRSPASYRPISLANSFYKLYASMHQHTNTASHLRLMIFCHPISSVFVNQDLHSGLLIRRLLEHFERHTTCLPFLPGLAAGFRLGLPRGGADHPPPSSYPPVPGFQTGPAPQPW